MQKRPDLSDLNDLAESGYLYDLFNLPGRKEQGGSRVEGIREKVGGGSGHLFVVFWQSGLWVFELGGQGGI